MPFDDIYHYIKQLQPECLVMDLNSAKYPQDALFYTDIKSFEQNAGQHISKEANSLPALSCLPLNSSWFWKTDFPTTPVKDPAWLVNENLVPFNRVGCTFVLNVAPNRDGLIDDNALKALQQMGHLWKGHEGEVPRFGQTVAPVTAENFTKHCPAEASWSYDSFIMDYANDDDFGSAWHASPRVDEPWYCVMFRRARPFNMVTLYDDNLSFSSYRLYYQLDGVWHEIPVTPQPGRMKVHRFDQVWADRVKVTFVKPKGQRMYLNEIGVYCERR